jgi:hypothetical protein
LYAGVLLVIFGLWGVAATIFVGQTWRRGMAFSTLLLFCGAFLVVWAGREVLDY